MKEVLKGILVFIIVLIIAFIFANIYCFIGVTWWVWLLIYLGNSWFDGDINIMFIVKLVHFIPVTLCTICTVIYFFTGDNY